MLDYKKRCPMPANRTPAVPPGRMSEVFQRALSEFGALEPTVLSHDPWVVSFDRFLAPDEVEAGGEQDSGPEPMHPHDGRRVYMPEPEDEGFVEGIVPDRKPYNAEEERMIALASQEEMVEYYYRMDGTRLKHPQKPKKWEEVGYRRYEDL